MKKNVFSALIILSELEIILSGLFLKAFLNLYP